MQVKQMSVGFALLGLVLMVGCSQRVTIPQTSDQSLEARNVEYKPQMVLFQGNPAEVKRWFESQQVRVTVEAVDESDHLYLAQYQSEASPEVVSQDLGKLSGVSFAEPNYVVRKQDMPPVKDPLGLLQWAVLNIGQDSPRGLQGTPGADIDVIEAWEKVQAKLGSVGSEDVVVAVIDTGIDYTHPELKGNMWVNKKEQDGMLGVDDDGNGYADDIYGWNFITDAQRHLYFGQLGHFDPLDDHGHGTHVAGIIGAKGGNYKGIMGINWKVRLMALKFLDAGGSGETDDAYRAIKYAIQNGAHILSNSWGGGGRSRALELIIQKAQDAGILFVAAAGNESSNTDHQPSYPASYEQDAVISVAASDNRDRIAKFSNYGVESVDIAAPGVDIMSTYPVNGDLPARAYRSFSGTSMATPMVSGAAALLMAYNPDLRRRGVEVKRLLMAAADRVTMLEGKVKSGGRLNINRALTGELNADSGVVGDVTPAPDRYRVISEEVKGVESPRHPEELVDKVWVIKHDGAVQTRVFFKELELDVPDFDLVAIYNLSYKHIFSVEDPVLADTWTPWIEDSGVVVRFANAMVQLDVTEWREYPSQEEADRAGATDCRASLNAPGSVRCKVSIGLESYANYESLGFSITKAEFRVKEGE